MKDFWRMMMVSFFAFSGTLGWSFLTSEEGKETQEKEMKNSIISSFLQRTGENMKYVSPLAYSEYL